jgi:hypothetical protein
MSYDNISSPANSNDAIVRETIEWFESGNTCDFAIIQFTYLERLEYVCNFYNKPLKIYTGLTQEYYWKDKYIKKIYEFSKQMIMSYYKEVYNHSDAMCRFYKNLFLLEQYFEKNNIKYYLMKINTTKLNFDKEAKLWKNICKHKYNELTPICNGILNEPFNNADYCEKKENLFYSGEHPSEIGHQKIANHVIGVIQDAL